MPFDNFEVKPLAKALNDHVLGTYRPGLQRDLKKLSPRSAPTLQWPL